MFTIKIPEVSEMILPDGIQLIGIMGRSGSGKSTTAEIIETEYENVYTENFADPLKRACSQAFGIPLEMFYDSEDKETDLLVWNTSPRKIAQFVGTEMFREMVDSNHWIYRMHNLLTQQCYLFEYEGSYVEGDTVIIGDVRFENEARYILQNNGIIIHLTRPQASPNIGIPDHASEQPVFIPPEYRSKYYVVNNAGSLDSLEENVKRILAHSCLSLTQKTSV